MLHTLFFGFLVYKVGFLCNMYTNRQTKSEIIVVHNTPLPKSDGNVPQPETEYYQNRTLGDSFKFSL